MLASPPSHRARLLVGGWEADPVPDALAYQACDAVASATTSRRLLIQAPGHETSSTTLLLVEAPEDLLARKILEQVIAHILPRWQPDDEDSTDRASLALRRLLTISAHAAAEIHVSIATVDWPQLQILYTGGNRHVLVRGKGHAVAVLNPRGTQDPGLATITLVNGDWLVLLANASSSAIPLTGVGFAVRDGGSPQSVCAKLVSLAAADFPQAHHAAVALAVDEVHDPTPRPRSPHTLRH